MRVLCLEILLNLQVGILDEEFLILRRVDSNQILPPLRKKKLTERKTVIEIWMEDNVFSLLGLARC